MIMEKEEFDVVKAAHARHIVHLADGVQFDGDCQVCAQLGPENRGGRTGGASRQA
ncbi:MAG: hypothetical protein JRN62_03015 [Nitrososphaerota archaeon]|jgi:hypothetical protein|nr:hypothetical protein [Nitrososphaerota archaeon]